MVTPPPFWGAQRLPDRVASQSQNCHHFSFRGQFAAKCQLSVLHQLLDVRYNREVGFFLWVFSFHNLTCPSLLDDAPDL